MAILGSNYLNTNYIAPSSFEQNGGIVQSVCVELSTQISQSIGALVATPITNLQASITPKRSTNSILIYARWCGEVATLWDSIFRLQRTYSNGVNTVIGEPLGLGSQLQGITCGMDTYAAAAANDVSTPAQMNFWYRDSPAVTSQLTYKILFYPSTARTLYTNRTVTNSNTASFELPTSAVYLFEVSG